MTTEKDFIEEYTPLVRRLASQVRAQFGLTTDFDDLMAFGFSGLVEARNRFDPSLGNQFNTFAYYRVRGAILDGVRKMSYLPPRVYRLVKAGTALDDLTETVGDSEDRTPSDAAKAMQDVLGKITASYTIASLGQSEDDGPDAPDEQVESKQEASQLRELVKKLPERERALVEGFYFDGRPFDAIAKELGISKSWASRIHAKALGLLKEALPTGD